MTDEKKPDDAPEPQAATPAEGLRPESRPQDQTEDIAGAELVPVDPDVAPDDAPHDADDPGFPAHEPSENIAGSEPVVEAPEGSRDADHGYPTREDAEAAYDHGDPSDAPRRDPDADETGEAELAAGLDTGSDLAASETAEPDERPAPYPDPEPAPAPYYDDHPTEDEVEDQGRTSLAARALQGLVILLVGAAIALWALPRVLPMLPAPVAEALAPASAVSPEDLAALRASFESRIAALETATPDAPDLGPVTARLDDLGARIEALEGAGPAASGSGSGGSDLGEANQAAIASLRGEMEAMSSTLAQLGDLPPEAAASLASASQRAASLSEKVDALTSRVDAAEARFDERATAAEQAAQTAQADAEAAEKRATLAAGFRAIGQALDEGLAFQEPLASISAFAEPPKALAAAAAGGVPTLASLRERFTDAGRRAMEAQGLAEAGDGFFDRATASLKARVSGVPVEAMEGDGLEARLGRAAAALRKGELSAALEALSGIPHPAQEAMADWLADARARQAAVAAAASWRVELGG